MQTDKLILIIKGQPFLIDTGLEELRKYNRPANTIPFSALQAAGEYYTLDMEDAAVRVPHEVIKKPESLSEWARLGINLTSQDQHWGIFIGDEALARRLSGELPHIDLAGTDFTIDWRLHELRETAVPWNKLNLAEMDIAPDGESFGCYYDTQTHEEFLPDGHPGEFPENIVILEIPAATILDPIAVAREYGLEDTGLLTRYPIRTGLAATVKPIQDPILRAPTGRRRQRNPKR